VCRDPFRCSLQIHKSSQFLTLLHERPRRKMVCAPRSAVYSLSCSGAGRSVRGDLLHYAGREHRARSDADAGATPLLWLCCARTTTRVTPDDVDASKALNPG